MPMYPSRRLSKWPDSFFLKYSELHTLLKTEPLFISPKYWIYNPDFTCLFKKYFESLCVTISLFTQI